MAEKKECQICTKCIMDTSDPNIVFDENGVCNHCREYDRQAKEYLFTGEDGEHRLRQMADGIKEAGKGREYDCIIGLSGGADSSYAAYVARKMGLRILGVTLDNGWNSEQSVNNIERLCRKLDIDLYTYVVDWEEFRDLQLAFLKASVVNIEAITDHAIAAVLYNTADERGIKYILTGVNIVTESVSLKSWGSGGYDLTNIKDIHKRFGTVSLQTYPTLSLARRIYLQYVKGIKTIPVLNYVPYVKEEAKKLLTAELGWKDYGGKHCESIFTCFYQVYILPRKFGIDKKRAHLSNLIYSGQLTREEALKEAENTPYTQLELKKDKEYVLKKLGLTNDEFEKIMNLPVKSHYDYESDVKLFEFLKSVQRILKKRHFLSEIGRTQANQSRGGQNIQIVNSFTDTLNTPACSFSLENDK